MRRLFLLAAAGSLAAAAAILYRVAPTEGSFYPRCVFHSLTGLHCPGCGATRCLHALLHGNLRQAAAYNPLFLLLLPALAVWAARAGYTAFTGRPLHARRLPAWSIYGLGGVFVAFWILRNLDYPLCRLLAPHTL